MNRQSLVVGRIFYVASQTGKAMLTFNYPLFDQFRYFRGRLKFIATWLNKEDDYQKLKEVTPMVHGYMFWVKFFKTTSINIYILHVINDVILRVLRAALLNLYAAAHE